MECEYETVPKRSNDTIFNDLERSVTQISRSRHYRCWISPKRYERQT